MARQFSSTPAGRPTEGPTATSRVIPFSAEMPPSISRWRVTGLDRLQDGGTRFFAVPVKVKGMGTFPVRAFGILEGG